MAKKVKAKRKFGGGVGRNAAKQQRGAQFRHLSLPKGLTMFKEEPKSRISFDIIPYEVTVDNHPDRDEEYGIAVKGSLWYKRPYHLHRNIGANNESVICPASVGQKCPICEHRAQLLKDGADWKDDSVKALKPSMRNLYLLVPIGDKKNDESVHLWDISQFLFQDKLNEEIQENEEYESFPDLEDGYTLRVRFSEETFANNKFAATSRIDFIERKSAYDEDIIDPEQSLDALISIPSYKSLEALFFGGLSKDEIDEDDDVDDEDDVEDDDVPKKKIHRKKKEVVEEEEEDEIDEDDVDDEEEEEEEEEVKKPVKRTRAKKKVVEEPEEIEEEEDEDVDEEEEEEPEPPKKKSTSKKATSKKATSKKGDDGKCPHGHRFGKDCEKFDECDDCELWGECIDASEAPF